MKEFYIIPNESYIEYREKGLVLKAIYSRRKQRLSLYDVKKCPSIFKKYLKENNLVISKEDIVILPKLPKTRF